MKMMWFTLCRVPPPTGVGVGVGSLDERPSPWQPARTASMSNAEGSKRETLFTGFIALLFTNIGRNQLTRLSLPLNEQQLYSQL
jgi:hypothetical protein